MKRRNETKKAQALDTDIAVLKACCEALNRSTTRKMLRANLNFLLDRFLVNPGQHLPKRLRL